MKKFIVLIAVLALITANARSQETETTILKTKKGRIIMPEAGDIGLSIDAAPFLDYVGNMFSQGLNTAPSFGFTAQNPGALTFKYFLSENMALRAGLMIGTTRDVEYIPNITDQDKLNRLITASSAFGFSAGIEFARPVKNRLRGYYGGVVGFETLPHIDGHIKFTDAILIDYDYEKKGGTSTFIYLGGIAGVEYFVAPKIALGGEFGLYFANGFTSARKEIYQDPVMIEDGTNEIIVTERSSGMTITTSASGSLKLSFYF